MAQFSIDTVQALLPLEPVAARASLMEADRRGTPGFDEHLERARRESQRDPARSNQDALTPPARAAREPQSRRDEQSASSATRDARSADAKRDEGTTPRADRATEPPAEEPAAASPSDEATPAGTEPASDRQPEHEKNEREGSGKTDAAVEAEPQLAASDGEAHVPVATSSGEPVESKGDPTADVESGDEKPTLAEPPEKVQPKPATPAVDESKDQSQPARESTTPTHHAAKPTDASGEGATGENEPQPTPSRQGAEVASKSEHRPGESPNPASNEPAGRGQGEAPTTIESASVPATEATDGKQGLSVPERGESNRPRSRNPRTSTQSINKQPAAKAVAPHGATSTSAPGETPTAPPIDPAAASLVANDEEPQQSQPTSQPTSPSSTSQADARQVTPAAGSEAGQDRAAEQGADRAVRSGSTADGKDKAADARSTGESNLTQAERVRLVQRVARAFQVLGDGGGQVRLRLSPPELGSVRVDVTIRNGTMTARLEAETASAREALLDNLPVLRERLAEQNVKLESFEVDLMKQSSQQAQDGAGDRRASHPRDGAQSASGSNSRGAAEETAADGNGDQSAPWLGNDRLNVVI